MYTDSRIKPEPSGATPHFSVCIPNYNYANYVGQTIQSALDQGVEAEILVSDNCSTDESVEVIKRFLGADVKLRQTPCNIGFAGNLDRACEGASGDRMLLLSSDDQLEANALSTFLRLSELLGPASQRAIFASNYSIIDGAGTVVGAGAFDRRLWSDAELAHDLSNDLGFPVWAVAASDLLRRSLTSLRTPFAFAATCFPRILYNEVGGYAGGYLYNPDKAFAWKLLAVADKAYFVDAPLVRYRVHNANQAAQQAKSGALKHLVDQYRSTFDTPKFVLAAAQISSGCLERAFVEQDVVLRGLKNVAEGNRALARRGLAMGRAAYPQLVLRSWRAWILWLTLFTGPLGTVVMRACIGRAIHHFRKAPPTKTLEAS